MPYATSLPSVNHRRVISQDGHHLRSKVTFKLFVMMYPVLSLDGSDPYQIGTVKGHTPCHGTDAWNVKSPSECQQQSMQTGGYEFSAAPRSVSTKRVKPARDGGGSSDRPQNIMYDRRIHRGSAYVTREETPDSPSTEARKKPQRPQASPQRQQQQGQQRAATPPPIDGRMHMDIQTDNYLEELTDRNPEVDVDTQTDALLDLHPPVSFVPMPSGIDVATQIENGDLFDFDLEVEPILEVLVGKTLEIGMLEVLEENEMREIRHRQEIFEQARNAELAEVQRLEAEAKRKYAEKQRRLDEEQRRLSAQAELEEKVAARAYAKRYLSDLHSQVFDSLVETGHFYDPILKDVREVFLPDVVQNAAVRAHNTDIARKLVENILIETIKRRSSVARNPAAP
ncbi:hypothetical protein Poli38472_013327 [Pythium oligandrum]|uniref:Radial spoke protein 3 n=1 Tax=Pythium oligandrum TaxID=41045 RepID=A0A8K1FGJ8_PYTOL|nr:hypothetical protein Poli38472_013327 [Pythium oligandrum]|eukprot:TMW57853.1 hypothetical protein Poli38472_013327 [Pythium oligandrum]